MELTNQIAKHLKEFHYGVNYTWSNLKEALDDLSATEATTKVYDFNTIAALTYHIGYYTSAVLKVLEGGPLDAHDKFSWETPPIETEADWQKLVSKVFSDADKMIPIVEALPEKQLWSTFDQEKYGNYYRNIHGLIEHAHYHLGQIVILKKLIRTLAKS